MYSREVNIVAWHLMLEELLRGNAQNVVDGLSQKAIIRVDIQVFVQQLVACSLAGWYGPLSS